MRTIINSSIALFFLALTFSPELRLQLLRIVHTEFVKKHKQVTSGKNVPIIRGIIEKNRKEWEWLVKPVPPEKLASSLKGLGSLHTAKPVKPAKPLKK